MKKQWRNRSWQVVVPALLVVNILLVWQNLVLRSRLVSGSPSHSVSPADFPERDILLPRIHVMALDGSGPQDLDFKGERTLILYFSPKCAICKKQFPLWKELAGKLPHSVKLLLMTPDLFSREEVSEFCASFGLESQRIVLLAEETTAELKLSVTPISMAVNSEGRVDKVWVGGWRSDTIQEVADYYGIGFEIPSPF